MTETSPVSNPQTPGTTPPTPGTTPSSDGSIAVLPLLSKAEAPISLTLTIDKSVGKVAAWVVGLVVAMAMLVGAGIVMSAWMIISYREMEREVRLQRLETDEMNIRLELAKIPKHQPGDKP
jgi:hypothetical protein